MSKCLLIHPVHVERYTANQENKDKTVNMLGVSMVKSEVVDQVSLVSMWLSVYWLDEPRCPDWLLSCSAVAYETAANARTKRIKCKTFCLECSTYCRQEQHNESINKWWWRLLSRNLWTHTHTHAHTHTHTHTHRHTGISKIVHRHTGLTFPSLQRSRNGSDPFLLTHLLFCTQAFWHEGHVQCLMLFVLYSCLISLYKNLWWHSLPPIKYS